MIGGNTMKVNKVFQLACIIFGVFVFVGCEEIQQIIDELKQPPSVIAVQLQPLSQEVEPFLQKSDAPNCPIDDFDVPGEGYQGYGMSGGIAALGASMPVESEARTVGKSMEDIASFVDLDGLERNAALIVLDDFNGSISKAKSSTFTLGKDVFSLLDSRLSSDLITRAEEIEQVTQDLEALGQLSHGAMVLNHILSLLQYLEGSQTIFGEYSELESDGSVTYFSQKEGKLLIQGVDTEDLNTSVIKTRLESALSNLQSQGYGRIAINMSFAIVPCGVVEDFQASRDRFPDFESYAKALADANKASLQGAYSEAEFLEIITELISTPHSNDSLIQFVNGQKEYPNDEDRQVYVASSGNYGLPYSLYLGAVENVVSVSAGHSDKPNVKKSFSNAGEVMDVGAWFRLSGVGNLRDIQETEVLYAGTSYSAPNVSVYSVLDLMQATPKCSPSQSSQSRLVQLSGSGKPNFNNKLLADAVSGC